MADNISMFGQGFTNRTKDNSTHNAPVKRKIAWAETDVWDLYRETFQKIDHENLSRLEKTRANTAIIVSV